MTKQNDLQFLQSLTEAEFTELVLLPTLQRMGFQDIRYTHGPLEYGKDVVFSRADPMDDRVHLSATVKRHPLSGSVSSSRGVREVFHQVQQAIKEPYIDPRNGAEIVISKTYIVTPFEISQSAAKSIRSELNEHHYRVAFLDGPRLLGRIQEFVPDLLNSIQSSEQRFVQALMQRLLKQRTSKPLGGSRATPMTELYTGGSLSRTSPDAARLTSFARPHQTSEALDFYNVFKARKFLVLLADVGAGKTTALQKLAYDLVLIHNSTNNSNSSILPVIVPLHRLPNEDFRSSEALQEGITDYLRHEEEYHSFSFGHSTQFVLLLDGFDEISDAHENAAKRIQELADIEGLSVVITSRPSRIPALGSPYEYYLLNPFSLDEIGVFLSKWFGQDRELGQVILERINSEPTLRIFCRTPLMLTLYSILAERMSPTELPSRRTGVYSMLTSALLGDWDGVREIKNEFSKEEKQFFLELLALRVHRARARRFSRAELLEVAGEFLNSGPARQDRQAAGLVNELVYRSSLLRVGGRSYLEFAHLSFQEFFAACRLFRQNDEQLMRRTIFDRWWRGTWIFYFGLKRSIDELSLSSPKKFRGKGDAILAYLAEADYSSLETRKKALRIVGNDILFATNLSGEALGLFAEYGLELKEVVLETIVEPEFSGNTLNFVRLLISIPEGRGLKDLFDHPEILRKLAPGHLWALLQWIVPHLWQEQAAVYFSEACSLLSQFLTLGHGKARRGLRMHVWNGAAQLSSEINSYVGLQRPKPDIERRLQLSLFRLGRAALPDWNAAEVDDEHGRLDSSITKFDDRKYSHWSKGQFSSDGEAAENVQDGRVEDHDLSQFEQEFFEFSN